MSYLFVFVWRMLFLLHRKLSGLISFPIKWAILKMSKSQSKSVEWESNFNDSIVAFPGGVLDWYAFGIVFAVLFWPLFALSLYFKIDIYTEPIYAFSIFGAILLLLYYYLFFLNKDWLMKKINKIKCNYDE